MIFQRSLIRYLFRRYLFLFPHPFLAFISPFLISFSLECRDAGQLRFPQFNFNLCPLSEERFNYWGGNGNNTECYLRLFSSHAQMLYDFFSLCWTVSLDAGCLFQICHFVSITKKLSFENVSNLYGNIFQKRSSWYSDLCEYK